MIKTRSFWKKYSVKTDQTLSFKAGYAEAYIRRVSNGWLVKTETLAQVADQMETQEVGDLLNTPDVLHFFNSGDSGKLILAPALPNKPVVFRNNKNIKVSAGESARLFFVIPLTMQFYFDEVKKGNCLLEVPLVRLSDTWFGETDGGEPAYSIGSTYFQSLAEVNEQQWEAIAPVEITNNSSEVLDLERLILEVEEFNLYRKGDQILTNHVAIEFKGQEQVENVNLSTRDDIHGDKFDLVADKRLTDSKKLHHRSFFFIKNIYQS